MKNARLLHYTHCVSDIERSKQFYVDVLGFEVMLELDYGHDEAVSKVMGVPDSHIKAVFMKRDGMRYELIAFEHPPADKTYRKRPSNEIGHSHITINVADLNEALAYFRSKGVVVEESWRASMAGGIEVCAVRDPDGFIIEVAQMPGLGLGPYEPPGS